MTYYNEFDPYPAAWLRNLIRERHISSGTVDDRSILEVQPRDIDARRAHFFAGIGVWDYALELAGWPDDAPVWTGSCPCQPFSVAGRGKGVEDERHLWPEWLRLIRECFPPVIFGEQVASKAGRAWLDAVRVDLEALGYAVGAADLCAAGVGAPHIRQRLYFGAVRLADSDSTGRGELGRGRVREDDYPPHGDDFDRRGAAGGLANSQRNERRQIGSNTGGLGGRGCSEGLGKRVAGGGALGSRGLGDTGSARAGRDAGAGAGAQEGVTVRAVGDTPLTSGPTGGFWGDVEWLYCRDDKYRPAQPGISPLAHGATGRVGRLRAYGNAIVSEVAAEFVKSFMEALENK